jgi:hypothetical protein
MKFKDYIKEETINEVLITFGNRPRFGQVVILAGGAGSGKGFMSKKLLGIDGKIFDVDNIKGKIVHPGTPKLNKKIKEIYGVDVTTLDFTNPDNVSFLHKVNDEMGISKKEQANFFGALSKDPEKLPNVIFDSTAKSNAKIQKICDQVQAAGYKKENIHLIWIMTDVEVAKKQNLDPTRGRVVPEDILIDTHTGVAQVMQNLLRNQNIDQFLDGYAYVIFNKAYVDNTLVFSKFGGNYVKDALIVEIKKKGKKQIAYSEIATDFIRKIKKYVPKTAKRLWENWEMSL